MLFASYELYPGFDSWQDIGSIDKFKQFERVNFFKALLDQHNSIMVIRYYYLRKLEELSFQMIYGFTMLSPAPTDIFNLENRDLIRYKRSI